MAIYQIFVKLLDGRTQCLQIPSPTVSGEALKRDLAARTQIPDGILRLVAGTREISDWTLVSADGGLFPSVSLLLRLRGGKGGFGSLLRGAATKAGQKKTNNFDACRDMSGRRLRHVNAEKKLEEWKAEEEDRRLEKLAEDFLRKKAKEVKKHSTVAVEKYLEKYREDSERCMEEVEESVRQSFELYKESKRKVFPGAEPSSKRLKIWLGKKKVEESDSDDSDKDDDDDDNGSSDHGDEKSVVLDEVNCSNVSKAGEGGSSVSGLVSGAHSDGESSGGGSSQSNLEEVNGNCNVKSPSVGEDSNSESNGSVETDGSLPEETAAENSVNPGLAEVQNGVVSSSEEVPDSEESQIPIEKPVEAETVAQSTTSHSLEEPLNFDKYDSAAELEVLGMERLKEELQAHGLKCGGTLQERAARLFLLKTTPLEKLPKKVLAKPVGGGK